MSNFMRFTLSQLSVKRKRIVKIVARLLQKRLELNSTQKTREWPDWYNAFCCSFWFVNFSQYGGRAFDATFVTVTIVAGRQQAFGAERLQWFLRCSRAIFRVVYHFVFL